MIAVVVQLYLYLGATPLPLTSLGLAPPQPPKPPALATLCRPPDTMFSPTSTLADFHPSSIPCEELPSAAPPSVTDLSAARSCI